MHLKMIFIQNIQHFFKKVLKVYGAGKCSGVLEIQFLMVPLRGFYSTSQIFVREIRIMLGTSWGLHRLLFPDKYTVPEYDSFCFPFSNIMHYLIEVRVGLQLLFETTIADYLQAPLPRPPTCPFFYIPDFS